MQIKVQGTFINVIPNINFEELIKTNHADSFKEGDADEPFYVCDLGDIVRKHSIWCKKLPRVEPFYAIKCNPDDVIVKTLATLNLGFDCASKGEITQALEAGVPPERIVYANPCKQASHIQFARENQVKLMTFDSEQELLKIKKCHPSALLVLRVFVSSAQALCPLGLKFGAKISDVPNILEMAISLNLNIVGVSFHVGSGCFDAQAYRDAILAARNVFDMAEQTGIIMNLLDIGGGFPGNIDEPDQMEFFDEVCSTINECLDIYFPDPSSVRIIAEPGRYYVSSAFQLACTVIAVRSTANEFGEIVFEYFLNDGVYGSFNCTVFDHYVGQHYLLDGSETNKDEPTFISIFWGPTCDSFDKILDGFKIKKLTIGDCVAFKGMGAYTMAAGSTFNGFKKPDIKYYASTAEWETVAPLLNNLKIEGDASEKVIDTTSHTNEPLAHV